MTRARDLIVGFSALWLLGAQGEQSQRQKDASAVQHVEIADGDDVLGRRAGPQGETITGTSRPPRSSLIVVRESFTAEMLQTAAELD